MSTFPKGQIQWGVEPELFGPKDWFRNSLILKEVKKYATGSTILDFGCGSGILMKRLDSLNFNVTGIDISSENIRYIQNHISSFRNKPNLKRGTTKDLTSFGEEFNCVVCGETLEHIKDDRAVIRSFHNILQDDGICVVSVPAHQSRFSNIDKYAGHFRRYEKEQLRNLFEEQQFQVLSLYSWGFPIGYIWDKLISEPVLRHSMNQDLSVSASSGIFSSLLTYPILKHYASFIFWIDMMFNWTEVGNGWILVARKVSK